MSDINFSQFIYSTALTDQPLPKSVKSVIIITGWAHKAENLPHIRLLY